VQNYILEIRKFLQKPVCEKILAYYEEDYQDAKITDTNSPVKKNIRNCEVVNLLESKRSFGKNLLLNYLQKELFRAAEIYKSKSNYFSVKNINQIDLLRYNANQHDAGYRFHVDQGTFAIERVLSVSICLNNEFIGGEFVFDLEGKQVCYPQNVGDLIMFPSNFLFPHQVNKVQKGTRYALISWLV
jgi:predicted 2-oxoglutarate/Fe(II)-dependent dioxygenase YbiX